MAENALITRAAGALPVIVAEAPEHTRVRFLEFFATAIRNPNTRRAYAHAVGEFLAWCAQAGVTSITEVQPLHVAAWIEAQTRTLSAPTGKQHLAAIRHLFDWLVIGQVIPHNPAASVRGPSLTTRKGKTPVLDATEARQLLDSIHVSTPIGLRDRALIGLMVFSFARVGAALAMRVDDVYTQNKRLWVRLREKGSKQHEMPCHHTLEAYLHAYIEGTGIGAQGKGPLFRTIQRGTARLSTTALPQANAHAMVTRRALAAGIDTKIDNHTFRATGITAYLKTVARSRTQRRWRNIHRLVPHNFTIDAVMTSALTRSNGSGCLGHRSCIPRSGGMLGGMTTVFSPIESKFATAECWGS